MEARAIYFENQWSVNVMNRRNVSSSISLTADTNINYDIQDNDLLKKSCICINFKLNSDKYFYRMKFETLLSLIKIFLSRLSQDKKIKNFIKKIKNDSFIFNFPRTDDESRAKYLFSYFSKIYNEVKKILVIDVIFVSTICLKKGIYDKYFDAFHIISNKKISDNILNEFYDNDVCIQFEDEISNNSYPEVYLTQKSFNQFVFFNFSKDEDYHSLMDETLENDYLFESLNNKKEIEKQMIKRQDIIYFNELHSARMVMDNYLRY